MEEDDDFGDLYTDVLSATTTSGSPLINQNTLAAVTLKTDVDEEGKAICEAYRSAAPTSEHFIAEKENEAASTEDANDDWLLGRDPLPVVEPANWVDDEEEIVSDAAGDAVGGIPARVDVPRVLEKEKEETASRVSQEEIGDELRGKGFPDKTDEIGDLDVEQVIPGLSSVLSPSKVPNGELGKPSGSDYWDSDSDDDLQIVLNESGHDLKGMVGRDDREGEDEDEDEDLVILTDEDQHHHHQAMEDQDWGSDVMQLSADGEKKEMLEGVKTGAMATTGSGSRIGYSNHIFHSQHHSMYKYVRPGAPPTPGGPCTTAAGTTSQVRPAVSGPMVGRGRGDWRPVGGKGYPHMQKGFHSGYGLPAWGNSASGRPFGIGLDFTLPSHKTVFDIDIESFEEKPWRYPGVDISDFFNFGLDEENWKEYCKHVEQIRLESTMQSKIRVYESGRSEQDYDPDLPPELAAATGTTDISTDNTNYGKSDNLPAELSGQGRGSVCVWPPLPTGRAIQVEGGYGERLPSIDTRPPRIRDADSVIEIVLQDNLGESTISNGVFEQSENNFRRKSLSDFHDVDEDDRPAGSDSHGQLSCTSNGQRQQRESMTRRIPVSLQGDGILPLPSDLSLQYNNSKSRSPVDTARSLAMQHGGRVAQRTLRGMKSTSEGSNEALFSQSMHLDKHDEDKEQAECVMEGNQAPELSHSNIAKTTKELSTEPKDVEHDDRLTLGDSHEGDGEEASDFRVSSEAEGDDTLNHSANNKDASTYLQQLDAQNNGDRDDSKFTHSDNSLARSENSMAYQKRQESGEEVLQVRSSKHVGDFHKHREENVRTRRDNYDRDGRRKIDRNKSRAKEVTHPSYAHKDLDSGSGHILRGRIEGFGREVDFSLGARRRRDDENHAKKLKDEDVRRGRNEDVRLRERSKLRLTDRNENIEDHAKKRVDDGDWRLHGRDGGLRPRERDEVVMNRRENLEDGQMKRKRDAEVARREKANKDDSLHGYRAREGGSRKIKERDDIVDVRKREDDARTKSISEDRHSSKHKDDNWYQRDREDRQRFKLSHDDTHALREREDRTIAARGGRPIEEKALSGNGRRKEDLKGAVPDKDYHHKDRRRHNEQSKRGDRTREENEIPNKVHETPHTQEKRLNAAEKSMRRDRSRARTDRALGASDGQQVKKEKNAENVRKTKEGEPVGQNTELSGKRKHEDHSTNSAELNPRGSVEQESNTRSAAGGKVVHGDVEQFENPPLSAARHREEDHASCDESHESRRGRSKLERWSSHKERDYSTIDNTIQPSSVIREVDIPQGEAIEADKAETTKADGIETIADVLQVADKFVEERDRHLDTVAKLRMRSERFKLPMPGEKDKDIVGNKKLENEPSTVFHSEAAFHIAASDKDIKIERPARKRKWTGS